MLGTETEPEYTEQNIAYLSQWKVRMPSPTVPSPNPTTPLLT